MTNNQTSSNRPATMRDLREVKQLFQQAKKLIAHDAAPPRQRSRDEILRGMISAVDSARPLKRRKANAVTAHSQRPVNPLRATDSFYRSPSGMIPT